MGSPRIKRHFAMTLKLTARPGATIMMRGPGGVADAGLDGAMGEERKSKVKR